MIAVFEVKSEIHSGRIPIVIPKASKEFPGGIYTDKFPSFDTLEKMTQWTKDLGATHIHFSNLHGGCFYKAKFPDRKYSQVSMMHFGNRYDWNYRLQNFNGYVPLGNNEGWYCDGKWSVNYFDKLDMSAYTFYTYMGMPLDYSGDDKKVLDYLQQAKKLHDVDKMWEI